MTQPTFTDQDIFELHYIPQGFTPEEWRARVELTLCYRLIDYYGWTAQVYNHISLRIPGTDHLLINGFGFLYNEIRPNNLVKIDMEGNPVEPTPYPVNKAGLMIHTAIHQAREDIACVIHTHDIDCQAVCAIEEGFIPLTQESCQFYERIGYHEFEGIVLDSSEKERLINALGDTNHTLMLHNHGVITAGPSACWALVRMYQLVRACKVQVRAMSMGTLKHPKESAVIKTRHQFEGGDAQAGANVRHPEWQAYFRLMTQVDPNWYK